jgi:hypothetical protein
MIRLTIEVLRITSTPAEWVGAGDRIATHAFHDGSALPNCRLIARPKVMTLTFPSALGSIIKISEGDPCVLPSSFFLP